MRTFTYATPTLITEALHLVIQAQLLLTSELMPYAALANSYGISVYDAYQFQGPPINNNDYSCHTYNSCKTCLINHMRFTSCHIMPLAINTLGGRHTHTHTHKHTYRQPHKNNFKKPGMHQPQQVLRFVKLQVAISNHSSE